MKISTAFEFYSGDRMERKKLSASEGYELVPPEAIQAVTQVFPKVSSIMQLT